MGDARKSMILLRADAIERGMQELAITYGWSAIAMGCEALEGPTRSIIEGAEQLRRLYGSR